MVSIEGPLLGRNADETPISKTLRAPESDMSGEIDCKVEALQLYEALKALPERQRLLVALRHNLLSPSEKKSLEDRFRAPIDVDPSLPSIAKLFGVSTQRVSVVYREGLAALASNLLGVDSVPKEEVKRIIDRFTAATRATR